MKPEHFKDARVVISKVPVVYSHRKSSEADKIPEWVLHLKGHCSMMSPVTAWFAKSLGQMDFPTSPIARKRCMVVRCAYTGGIGVVLVGLHVTLKLHSSRMRSKFVLYATSNTKYYNYYHHCY